MKNIYLICGYKGTGKDTLYKYIREKRKDISHLYGIKTLSYAVLSTKDNKFDLNKYYDTSRISFADLLKEEVIEIYSIPEIYNTDDSKDIPITEFEIDNELDTKMKGMDLESPYSFRDFCIYHAKIRRDEDSEYWIKKSLVNFTDYCNNMVTDFRYPNEEQYLKSLEDVNVITIRVFRSCIEIPPQNMISEHQLDDFTTDYVLVPYKNTKHEIEKLKEKFPQYADYEIIEYI